MNIDEIAVVRAARPEVPDYDPAAKARLCARFSEEPATPVRRGRSPRLGRRGRLVRRRLVAVGAMAAALAVGVAAVQNMRPAGLPSTGGTVPGAPLVMRPVADAEDLAHNAAVRAAARPADRPRPGQWGYVKNVMAVASGGLGGAPSGSSRRRIVVERWSRIDGARSAYLEKGRLKVRDVGAMERSGSPRTDYPYLLALPTSDQALLDRVYQVIDAEGGRKASEEDKAARAFEIFQAWMRDKVLPPQLRAAMYGAIARLPGVGYEPSAHDIAGRKGVTLYRVDDGYLRTEIIVDPATYAYLGFRNLAVEDGPVTTDDHGRGTRVRKGRLLGWGGMIDAAIVDGPGRRHGPG